MANANVNKVVYGNRTLIDLTSDTVAAASMLSGVTAHDKSGAVISGSITSKTSSDLTASGATVSVPSGYYASNASKSISSGSAKTPATTITSAPSISVDSSGLITATNSKTQSVTPTVSAGYVSAGTAGTITVNGSNTSQLSTQAAKTVTPTRSEQTVVAAGKYTTGAVKVAAIPNTYYTQEEALELFYPVGSIYMSTSSTAPDFGGTWEEIKITVSSWNDLNSNNRSYVAGAGTGTVHYWRRTA